MKTNSNEKFIREVFYLSKKDRESLRGQSSDLRVSTSFFVRNCVLKELGKQVMIPKEKDDVLTGYRNALVSNGNLLNQIARKVNSGIELKLTDEGKLIKSIRMIQEHILEIQAKI